MQFSHAATSHVHASASAGHESLSVRGTVGVSNGFTTCKTLHLYGPANPRLSGRDFGALLDRIDIHIELPKLTADELVSKKEGETSTQVRQRVVHARKGQQCRMVDTDTRCNAQMGSQAIRQFCAMDKVSRTIADLEGTQGIEAHHVAEAISFRAFDRKL